VTTPATGGRAGEAPLKCPSCAATVTPDLPFCGQCGARLTPSRASHACNRCGRANEQGFKFCPACGASYGGTGPQAAVSPAVGQPVSSSGASPKLALLDRSGEITQRFELVNAVTTVGRQGADINFSDDDYLSPLHAQFLYLDGILSVRDLGSKNGTWLYLDEPHRLSDGDMILVGSQVLRYRRLGYPGPRPPEQDQTRRLGSYTPSADIANLGQIRSDGSVRDVITLSPGRTVRIGREQGDWQFPYDSSMSSQHAVIRSEDADFVLVDTGSRNGVAVAVRGERRVPPNGRLLIGDQMIRAELG
jgi:pSer/pThr/pTyr-binding forkhead associated (FHA) protein